jgi:predicted peptidase
VATAGPDKFAMAIPMSGRDRGADTAPATLKYLSTWIIVGGADGDFTVGSNKMYAALLSGGCDVHLTVIPNEGHGGWERYYNDRRFYDYLMTHRRLSAQDRAERDRCPKTDPSQMLAHPDKHPEVLRAGHHWLAYATQLGGKPYNLQYCLYLPQGYENGKDPLPMTVVFHRDDDRANDRGLIFEYGAGVDPRRDAKTQAPYPMIGLAPQLPPDRQWADAEMQKILVGLIDEVSKAIRVDADRVYLTGMQNGGSGAWALAIEEPNRFAALAPFQAGVVKPDEAAKKLAKVAIRAIAPQNDGGAVNNAKQMVEVMKKAGADVELKTTKDAQDPSQWFPYYTDPEMVKWLMGHRRGK